MSFRHILSILVASMLFLAVLPASAQGFPSQPVKVIVPNPPGGVTDTLARLVGSKLSEAWGQPVIVENRPGGNQTIGAAMVVKAPADGHTLFVSDGATFVANPHLYSKLSYDPVKDFTPIMILAQISPVLSVAANVPANNVKELIALAKAKPGTLSYGSYGSGTYAHVSMEEFKQVTGTDFVHVPYKGATPAVNDLVGGQISALLSNLSTVEAFAKAGKVKILGAGTAKRLVLRPDIPTISESGVPGFETGAWFALVGPANLPGNVVTKIYTDANRVLHAPDAQQTYVTFALEMVDKNPEQFAQYMQSELQRWGKLIKATGARID